MKTVKMHNPYSGKSWEVAEPDPCLGLPTTAVILIMNGEQKIVHRRKIGSLKLEGTGWYTPEFIEDWQMRLLLDTNIVFFMATEPDRLSKDVSAILYDYDNQLYMSAESVKEMIVAYRNKRLGTKVWKNEMDMIHDIKETLFIEILPVTCEHMETYARLKLNELDDHRDPSDHVIIAHAITEKLSLISSDHKFPFYESQGLNLIRNK